MSFLLTKNSNASNYDQIYKILLDIVDYIFIINLVSNASNIV
jgi:hypothetical protein